MGEKTANTNLSSEYYVLSMLYRIGAEAYLTLGNKKSVDIVIKKGNRTITVDVKGMKGTTSFPIDNIHAPIPGHFLAFVSFLNKIENHETIPEVYILPSSDLYKNRKELKGGNLIYNNPKGNRKVVNLSKLRKLKKYYEHKWEYFL